MIPKLTYHLLIPCLALFFISACQTQFSGENSKEAKLENSKTLLEQLTKRKIPAKELKIIIKKKARTLSVKYKDEVLVTYPCVLGFAPEGDKMQQGDGKTPEGTFGIRSMYAHKSWSYFIWVDYPNNTSRERFEARKKSGEIPKSAKIGGEIGIHGVPTDSDDLIDSQTDWTLGCISLKTADITDLYKSISKETTMEILK